MALLDSVACTVAQSGKAIEPPAAAPPSPRRPPSKAAKKRELMEQARRAGWKGTTYHSALKFERALERGAR